MSKKPFIWFLCVALLASAAWGGCQSNGNNVPNDDVLFNGGNPSENYYRLDEKDLPEEISEWINNSLNMNLGQKRVYDDKLFILVTYGEKPTGGYSVDITKVEITETEIQVDVNFKSPKEGDIVTQAVTYPYDMVVTSAVDLPVVFNVLGDEEYLMTFQGIDNLKPIEASSAFIKIFEPAPNSEVERNFIISGVASVFEGNIVYEIIDSRGNSVSKNYATAGMGDWYYFEIPVTVPPEIDKNFKVELYSPSALDGSKTQTVSLLLKVI